MKYQSRGMRRTSRTRRVATRGDDDSGCGFAAVAVAMEVGLVVVQAEFEPMAVLVVAESAIVVDGVFMPRMDMESEMIVTAVMAERAVVAVAALVVLSVVARVTRT
eukprot:9012911-Pyramimonas_sp.AAC.1